MDSVKEQAIDINFIHFCCDRNGKSGIAGSKDSYIHGRQSLQWFTKSYRCCVICNVISQNYSLALQICNLKQKKHVEFYYHSIYSTKLY